MGKTRNEVYNKLQNTMLLMEEMKQLIDMMGLLKSEADQKRLYDYFYL